MDTLELRTSLGSWQWTSRFGVSIAFVNISVLTINSSILVNILEFIIVFNLDFVLYIQILNLVANLMSYIGL